MRCVMNVVIVPLPSLTLHLCSHAPATLSPHKYPFPFSAYTLPFSLHTPEQHTNSPTTQTATQKDAPPLFLNVSGGAILYPSLRLSPSVFPERSAVWAASTQGPTSPSGGTHVPTNDGWPNCAKRPNDQPSQGARASLNVA